MFQGMSFLRNGTRWHRSLQFPALIFVFAIISFLFIFYYYRPLISPFPQQNINDLHLFTAAKNKFVAKLPLSSNASFRFLYSQVQIRLPQFQTLPLRMEIKGGSLYGPTLDSIEIWNPQKTSVTQSGNFDFFSWSHDSFYLTITAKNPQDLNQIKVDLSIGSHLTDTFNSKDGWDHNGWSRLYRLLFLSSVLTFIVVGPLCLLHAKFELKPPGFIHRLQQKNIALIALAIILLFGLYKSWIILKTIYLPGFSYCNDQWTSWDLKMGEETYPLFFPFYNYAPGIPTFFKIIFEVTKFMGFPEDGVVYRELSYRFVMISIAFIGNISLYFFLVKLFKESDLPGQWIFPLLPVSFLALHPDLIFTYMTAQNQGGLLIAFFVALMILSYRLAFHRQNTSDLILWGLLGGLFILWRNELKLVPFIYLTLIFCGWGLKKCTFKTISILLISTLSLPLLYMSLNQYRFGKFEMHQASLFSVSISTHVGNDYRDNAMGFMYDDMSVVKQSYFLTKDFYPNEFYEAPNNESNAKYSRDFFFKYASDHPDEILKAWQNRTPNNVFNFVRNALPGTCENVHPRLISVIPQHYTNYFFLVTTAGLILLPFAIFANIRFALYFLIPSLFAIYAVGMGGSGIGYTPYAYLTILLSCGLGLSQIYKYCLRFYRWSLNAPQKELQEWAQPYPLWIQVSTVLFGALLMVAFWIACKGYNPTHENFIRSSELNSVDRGKRIFENNQHLPSINIKWMRKVPSGTMPREQGHLLRYKNNVVFTTYEVLMVLNAKTGEGKQLEHSHGNPNFTGYFSLRDNLLFLVEHTPNDVRKRIRFINLDTLDTLGFSPVGFYVQSKFLIDEKRFYHIAPNNGSYHLAGQEYHFDFFEREKEEWSGKAPAMWSFNEAPSVSGIAQSEHALYLGTVGQGKFYAVDKSTGQSIWSYQGKTHSHSTPVIHNKTVIYGDIDGTIYQLHINDGSLVQKIETNTNILNGIEVVGDVVYSVSWDEFITASDLKTGKMLWKIKGYGGMKSKPAYKNGHLYVGSGTWLLKINAATGEVVWKIDLGTYVMDTPLFHNNMIIVRSLYAVYGLEEHAIDTPRTM